MLLQKIGLKFFLFEGFCKPGAADWETQLLHSNSLFRRILPNFHSRGNYQSNSQVVLLTLITSKCGVWKCLKKIYPKGQLAPRWWVSDHGNLWEPGEEDREGLLRFIIGLTQLGIAPSSCGNHSLTRREKGRLIEREPLSGAGRKKHSLIPLISSDRWPARSECSPLCLWGPGNSCRSGHRSDGLSSFTRTAFLCLKEVSQTECILRISEEFWRAVFAWRGIASCPL